MGSHRETRSAAGPLRGRSGWLTRTSGETPTYRAGTHSPGEDAGLESEALEAVKLALALGNDVNVVDASGAA